MVSAEAALPVVAAVRSRRRLPIQVVVGVALMSIVVGAALISLVWTPYEAERINVAARLTRPGVDGHLLGTDALGRDVLSQIMAGARHSLYVSLIATTVALIPGIALGLITSAAGPRLQSVLLRAIDLGLAFPGILVALVLAVVLGPGRMSTVIALVVWFVPSIARITIGPAQQILGLDFIAAAYGYGRGRIFVLVRHVLPNIGSLLAVVGALFFAQAILLEASLSFLGLGVPRPTPSWGLMLPEGRPYLETYPHLVLAPGLAIVIAVLGFTLLGEGLRVALDPRRTRETAR